MVVQGIVWRQRSYGAGSFNQAALALVLLADKATNKMRNAFRVVVAPLLQLVGNEHMDLMGVALGPWACVFFAWRFSE